MWLTDRTFSLAQPIQLSWEKLYRQSGADPAKVGEKVDQQAFRRDCLRELKNIQAACPELRYKTAKGVLIVSPSKPKIPLRRLAD